MTDNNVIGVIVCVMLVVAMVAPLAGYTVQGNSLGMEALTAEGMALPLAWLSSGAMFLFNAMTFRIDGLPVVFSILFDLMLALLVFVVVKLVRGTAS